MALLYMKMVGRSTEMNNKWVLTRYLLLVWGYELRKWAQVDKHNCHYSLDITGFNGDTKILRNNYENIHITKPTYWLNDLGF